MDVSTELKKARSRGYAIGAFNTSNLEVTKAICLAAKKYDKFILIQTTPSAIEYAGLQTLFDIVRDEIENSGIKAAIHLDHAMNVKLVKEAIDIGYSSVMFDGSKLPLEENLHLTHQVVKYAHERGVCVEAEVGVIGHEEGGKVSGQSVLSAPDQVADFIASTGIDSIAISVGNQHGAPEGEKLDLKLLKKISEVIEIPLVMHGASGLTDGDIREAISCGVAKFNIDTKLRRAFTNTVEESREEDFRDAAKEGMEAVEKVVEKYVRLFSN